MLKIFSDRTCLPADRSHVHMLIPFWGLPDEDPALPTAGRFERYAGRGRQFFQLTSLEDADVVVYPCEWQPGRQDAGASAEAARDAGKPLIVFFNSDSDENLSIPGSVVFRTSLYRSCRKPNEFALPCWSEDFLQCYCQGSLQLRQLQTVPAVSYCGYGLQAGMPALKRNIKKALGIDTGGHPGMAVRSRALGALKKSTAVACRFVIREGFWGGALVDGRLDARAAQARRREYVHNMLDADYVLCARGGGNFSYRLYETLSLGRIPVFVDTDCVLPFEDRIPWRDICVWVDEKNISHAADHVAAFHANLTPGSFEDVQRTCRRVWETWLSPEGFFSHFEETVRGYIGSTGSQ